MSLGWAIAAAIVVVIAYRLGRRAGYTDAMLEVAITIAAMEGTGGEESRFLSDQRQAGREGRQ